MNQTLSFITNYCPHYRRGFFERLDERIGDRFDCEFLFTGIKEKWQSYGDFSYRALGEIKLHENYSISPSLFYQLWQKNPDVIVAGPIEEFAGQAPYLYAKATKTPFVLWTGEWRLPQTTLRTTTFPLIKRIYHGADSVVVYGPHIKEYVTDLGVPAEKIHIGWNTTDIDRFTHPDPDAEESVRASLGIPQDAPVALFVGRHVKEKGLGYLLDAFRQIVSDVEPTPYLVLVGDGNRHDVLREQAADLETVLFPGYVDNDRLPPYYGLADVFVLPSILTEDFREPWGLVINEAMGSGTPVIASSEVGAAAAGVVRDCENGYIVPERNTGVLADRLKRLLSNPAKAEQMGQAAEEGIKEYSFDKMVDGFEDAIHYSLQS